MESCEVFAQEHRAVSELQWQRRVSLRTLGAGPPLDKAPNDIRATNLVLLAREAAIAAPPKS